MYTDSHVSEINVPSWVSRPETTDFPFIEERYQQAKARLSAAQQEKMEADFEFLAARAALRDWMEAIWPGQEGEESAAETAHCPASGLRDGFDVRPVRPRGRQEGQHGTLTFESLPARIGSEESE